ncbi:protein-L-isoaspartate(D-aspartate) O-methyltransferase [Gracilimonas amylolytica]|uniref:protein-L-isoaspartate(D-aspartate) O-methyltransferase n=1 Tax=Gracilimonas amylolytica TaxID=1749045 RepID=UPI001E497302|nr:protein-L-isoaspartate(D-aspartate) O-methyltransferase [Gracilimonas amylolytica]
MQQDRRFVRPRRQLVEHLKEKGIKDPKVLAAIGKIPRHKLIDTALYPKAYKDTALPIGMGQTISQPFTVAAQTELLAIEPGDKILEIGTGSGYQCMVLCEMGADVYSVERHKDLYHRAKESLKDLGYNAMLKVGDGTLGWSTYAPYDGIVVTAGAPVVPDDLVQQLNIGGRLVIPVGDDEKQMMLRITRVGENDYEREELADFKFVPLIGEKGWGE